MQKVAEIIRESFDHDCSSYRIGGDEFYVLCRNSDPEKADHQLKSMTSRLTRERKIDSILPTVAYGRSTSQYVIVGLIYFLIFINSVSTQVQASGLIMRLHHEATARIRQYRDFVELASVMTPEELLEKTSGQTPRGVYGLSDGYIQEINYFRLQRIAREHDCIICTNKVVGQFISSETRIITLYH